MIDTPFQVSLENDHKMRAFYIPELDSDTLQVSKSGGNPHSGQWGSIRAGICPEYVQTRLSYSHANPAGQVSQKVDIFHTGLLVGEK